MSVEVNAQRTADAPKTTAHPRALAPMVWLKGLERLSFYGMQGVLILYLVDAVGDGGLGLPDAAAYSISGAYAALVYFSTIVGAWVADRLLSPVHTLIVSSVTVLAGHAFLSLLPGMAGLAAGLVCIALGSGGVLVNVTAVVGNLYTKDDPQRDPGFLILYQASCFASFLGPILTGWLQVAGGYHLAFGLAALFMAAGLVVLLARRSTLSDEVRLIAAPLSVRGRWRWTSLAFVAGVAIVLAVLFGTGALNLENLALVSSMLCIVGAVATFAVMFLSKKVTVAERRNVRSFVPLWIVTALFIAVEYQAFLVIPLWIQDAVNRDLFGWMIPIPWITAIGSLSIAVAAAILGIVWSRTATQPSSAMKLGLGVLILGAAYLGYAPLNAFAPSLPVLVILPLVLIAGASEALVGPAGMSLATRLAPRRFATQMSSLYFLSWSTGASVAGVVATLYTPENHFVFFGAMCAACVLAFGLMWAVSRRTPAAVAAE